MGTDSIFRGGGIDSRFQTGQRKEINRRKGKERKEKKKKKRNIKGANYRVPFWARRAGGHRSTQGNTKTASSEEEATKATQG